MNADTPIAAEQLLEMPVAVCRSRSDIEALSAGSELDGSTLLPGFRCPIADLFVNL
ncbi:MAG TPA: hypothetical protein VNE39_00810 [Planctomycetota bacterium]|nr:hypothetical protein [Planctomycetota bacterium]